MKTSITYWVTCVIWAFVNAVARCEEKGTLELMTKYTSETRILVPTNSLNIVCTVSNRTSTIIQFEYFNAYVNAVRWHQYGEKPSEQHTYLSTLARLQYPLPESYGIVLNPGQKFVRMLNLPHPPRNCHCYTNHELNHFWHWCRSLSSPMVCYESSPLWAGYCRDESPVIPSVCTFTNECLLAVGALFDLSKQGEPHIGFFVMNGSDAAVTVAQPLFNDSRLIVHAPKIGYSNEVFAVYAAATNATVAARGTTEWRVPWTNLWSRLPAADRTSLTNAHEVDLYWRSGEFTSEALPLWIE